MKVILNWIPFSSYETAPDESGLYLYCLKDFGLAPFYIGTAGETPLSSLRSRLHDNQTGFTKGERTFFKRNFFKSNLGSIESFILEWEKINKNNWSESLFIPKMNLFFDKSESLDFWENRLVKFYSTTENFQDRNALRSIEAQLQNMIRKYLYLKSVDLRFPVPDTKSYLLGQMHDSDMDNGRRFEIDHQGVPSKIFEYFQHLGNE